MTKLKTITKTREPSENLLRLIEKANEEYRKYNESYGHLKEKVKLAYQLAIGEGYTPREALKLLLEKCEAGKTTIYEALPQESKDRIKAMARSAKKSVPERNRNAEEDENVVNITEKGQIQINIPSADVDKDVHTVITGAYIPGTDSTIEKEKSIGLDFEGQQADYVQKLENEVKLLAEEKRLNALNLDAANSTIAEKNAVIARYRDAAGKESERIESKLGKDIEARGETDFLLKKIAKLEHDLSGANIKIEDKDRELAELKEALKKSSFPKATDYVATGDNFPDTDTARVIFTARNIHIDKFRNRLGEIKASLNGHNAINVCIMKAVVE